jgi:hypothetical protein
MTIWWGKLESSKLWQLGAKPTVKPMVIEPIVDWKDPEFWRLILLTQVREFEQDIRNGNLEHAAKEVVDVLTVALDCLNLLYPEKTTHQHIMDRAIENSKKGIFERNKWFYKNKLDHIEHELGYHETGESGETYDIEQGETTRQLREDTFD